MVDIHDRWCLFCDLEIHPNHVDAPYPKLDDYVDEIIHRAHRGAAKRIYEHDTRVARIWRARRVELADGSPALSLLITLGNRRGATPAFIHFENGNTRDAEKEEDEVKGASAHCLINLTEAPEAPGRYRMILEEAPGIGRTPVTRLLGTVLKEISKDWGEQFRNPATNRMINVRPVVEIYPRKSRELAAALDRGGLLPVELFDTRPSAIFDERPEFRVRRHLMTVKVVPAPGRTFREAVDDLREIARESGYDRMRVSWRMPGEMRGGSAEIETDLADIGTAVFAHRELFNIPSGLSECSAELNDEFVGAMVAALV